MPADHGRGWMHSQNPVLPSALVVVMARSLRCTGGSTSEPGS